MAARRCVFSALAESDLAEVANYIESYKPRAALKLVRDIRRLCATLTENPARHRLREEYGAGVRVAVLGKYLVFYADRDDNLTIERVLHGARHLDWVQL